MLRHACLLFLLLSVIAALAQTAEVMFPDDFRQNYTVRGKCQRAKSSDQRHNMRTGAGPTPTLDDHPSTATKNHKTTEYKRSHRRKVCPVGFKCSKGYCKKMEPCPAGYVSKGGFCRKRGKELMLTTTAPIQTTLKQLKSGIDPYPTMTLMQKKGKNKTELPTRCHGGNVKVDPASGCRKSKQRRHKRKKMKVPELDPRSDSFLEPTATESVKPTMCHGGNVEEGSASECRKSRKRAHRRKMSRVPKLVPRADSFLEPTSTESVLPTMLRARERCPDGYAYVRGRCMGQLNVKEARSADSQSREKPEMDLEAAVADNKEMKPLLATNNQQGEV